MPRSPRERPLNTTENADVERDIQRLRNGAVDSTTFRISPPRKPLAVLTEDH